MMGKVYIVGAGCGSYELLTLKAKEILSFCDCVIYDRLVDESVLQFVNKNAELVYLGKEHENPMRQNTINETILKYSSNGKIVARLKGGDPLVFGRGGEELDFLYDNNIDFEIVPGISSSIASCEYAGIPLTYRNISRSFHVFTAHAMREYNFLNFEIISKLEGTLVFLMGVANLEKIVNGLIENGKSKESRISIVENACRPKQRVIVGKLENIVSLSKENKIKSKILSELNRKYGICEIDFARSDIRFVPSFDAKYVGIDKGLVAGYGQDDRVCAYATVSALINIAKENIKLNKTAVAILVDKEEIGSEGNTSMSSDAFTLFVAKMIKLKEGTLDNLSLLEAFNNSKMLSADVSCAVDPMHEHLSDIQNANIIGCGIAIEKYTGSGGKYSANDASAKFMSEVMSILDKEKVPYQIGTLGKIGKGGGGTIAYILANKGVEVVDMGTALLSMHSPYELASVGDIYTTYKAYKAFFKA